MSKVSRSLSGYLRKSKDFWQYLPPDLLEIVELSLLKKQPSANANALLFKASVLISREKKRYWFNKYGYDYIEGLNIHNTHPAIYAALKACGVHTIHQLRAFVPNIKLRAAAPLRLKYPELIELYHWWHTTGESLASRRTP